MPCAAAVQVVVISMLPVFATLDSERSSSIRRMSVVQIDVAGIAFA
jgi:hypothetical protein